jgi:hypothetical protein
VDIYLWVVALFVSFLGGFLLGKETEKKIIADNERQTDRILTAISDAKNLGQQAALVARQPYADTTPAQKALVNKAIEAGDSALVGLTIAGYRPKIHIDSTAATILRQEVKIISTSTEMLKDWRQGKAGKVRSEWINPLSAGGYEPPIYKGSPDVNPPSTRAHDWGWRKKN